MRDIYTRLQSQPFPSLGEVLEMAAIKFEHIVLMQDQRLRRTSLGSLLCQSLQKPPPPPPRPALALVKKIKRPIDFRLEGSPICRLLTTEQILMIYATVLQERRLLVISSSLR